MHTTDFDPIYDAFLERTEREAGVLDAESHSASIFPLPTARGRPSRYAVVYHGIEHYVRRAGEPPQLSDEPIFAAFHFPPDYLRADDPTLLFRVVQIASPVVNPNVSGPILCLGSGFRPGTSLRVLLHQVWAVFAAGRFSTTSPLDREAADFYVANAEKIRSLRAAPLFRTPAVSNLRRVDADAGPSDVEVKA